MIIMTVSNEAFQIHANNAGLNICWKDDIKISIPGLQLLHIIAILPLTWFYSILVFKGTLMQIWKSPYMSVFLQKQYPENFTFLIQRILELFACEVCKYPKK